MNESAYSFNMHQSIPSGRRTDRATIFNEPVTVAIVALSFFVLGALVGSGCVSLSSIYTYEYERAHHGAVYGRFGHLQ